MTELLTALFDLLGFTLFCLPGVHWFRKVAYPRHDGTGHMAWKCAFCPEWKEL